MFILFSYVFLFPVSNNSFTQIYNISTGLNAWEELCVDLWNSLSVQPLPVLYSGFQTWDTLFSSPQWMFRLCISFLWIEAWKSSQGVKLKQSRCTPHFFHTNQGSQFFPDHCLENNWFTYFVWFSSISSKTVNLISITPFLGGSKN